MNIHVYIFSNIHLYLHIFTCTLFISIVDLSVYRCPPGCCLVHVYTSVYLGSIQGLWVYCGYQIEKCWPCVAELPVWYLFISVIHVFACVWVLCTLWRAGMWQWRWLGQQCNRTDDFPELSNGFNNKDIMMLQYNWVFSWFPHSEQG